MAIAGAAPVKLQKSHYNYTKNVETHCRDINTGHALELGDLEQLS